MNRYFYIDAEGKQKGTFTHFELKQENVKRDTLVWTQGMEQWRRAEEVEELQYLFYETHQAGSSMEVPYATPSAPDLSGDIPPLKPSNWLWPSILATLFCCNVFGIVGIVYAARVDSLYYAGKYGESEQSARQARTWTLIAAAVGLIYVIGWASLLITGNFVQYMESIIENSASGYNF